MFDRLRPHLVRGQVVRHSHEDVLIRLGVLGPHVGHGDPRLQRWAPSRRGDLPDGLPVGVRQQPAACVPRAIQQQGHAPELGALRQLEEQLLPTKHQVAPHLGLVQGPNQGCPYGRDSARQDVSAHPWQPSFHAQHVQAMEPSWLDDWRVLQQGRGQLLHQCAGRGDDLETILAGRAHAQHEGRRVLGVGAGASFAGPQAEGAHVGHLRQHLHRYKLRFGIHRLQPQR
mmetsp:Transcript_12298/g.31784  ORF Transcript_12298/g.31784 Transcript_12298/m.31784 type:complete len:228 (-) Transcript_12298:250-933(-)